jgi:hypothetical protein
MTGVMPYSQRTWSPPVMLSVVVVRKLLTESIEHSHPGWEDEHWVEEKARKRKHKGRIEATSWVAF